MAWTTPGTYLALSNTSDCEDCGDSNPNPSTVGCKECSCCPPGFIELKDESGKVIGCVTGNDAQEYMKTAFRCPDGYVRQLDAQGNFQGCVSVADYLLLNP